MDKLSKQASEAIKLGISYGRYIAMIQDKGTEQGDDRGVFDEKPVKDVLYVEGQYRETPETDSVCGYDPDEYLYREVAASQREGW